GKLQRFLDVGDEFIQVRKGDFETALKVLTRDGHPIAHDLELWKLEPLKARFARIADQAKRLADRLGKAPIKVNIEHGGVRVNSDVWAPFWAAFVHAVRNAVDHGLESPEEREKLAKGPGTLTLKAYFLGGWFNFEFSDDGRGINWDKIRTKAAA